MSNFGKRTLVLWYSTNNDYSTFDNADNWRERSDDFVALSEPFDVEIIESTDAAQKVNAAKIDSVDNKIAAARELLETLKGERANLLAITHEESS